MQREDLGRLAKFGEAKVINNDLNKIYDVLEKEFKQSKKPDSIVGRVIVDGFGLLVLYLLLFVACDLTRAVITDGPYFGFKWLIWGPYYFFTKAPIMTRVWKSKKFLEDLSNYDSQNIDWPNTRTCTSIGQSYTTGCNNAETHHNKPIRDHLGKGLDWVLSHMFGGTIGKFLNNATCEQQGATISHTCASDRVDAAYDCYTFFCSAYGLGHVATRNFPNEGGDFDYQTGGWDGNSKEAYRKYYEVYTAIYDIGSTLFGNSNVPTNLNPAYDDFNNYCFNAGALYAANWYAPPWWFAEDGPSKGPCFFQQNYKRHMLDFFDPV